MRNGKFRSGHTVAEVGTLMQDLEDGAIFDGTVDRRSHSFDRHARAAALLTVENAAAQMAKWLEKRLAA